MLCLDIVQQQFCNSDYCWLCIINYWTELYQSFSLCFLKGVGEGCVLGGVTNHIKAFKPHLLKRSKEVLAQST